MSVQEVALEFNCRLLLPIHPIPHDGTAQEGQVQPDLVRPPGKRMDLQQRGGLETLQRAVFASGSGCPLWVFVSPRRRALNGLCNG